jgi:hypothetical protein
MGLPEARPHQDDDGDAGDRRAMGALKGHAPGEADIDEVYEVFVPMNEEVVAQYATLVPGAARWSPELRGAG